jgi:hypothetical protein
MSTPEEQEPESQPLDADRKRRTKMLAVGAVGVLVVAGVGFYLLSASIDRKAQAHIEEEFDRLSKCSLGPAPLAAGESAAARFRNLQLTAMAIPAEKRAEAGGIPWPARCAMHAHGVSQAWKDAGRGGKDPKDLGGAAEEFAKLLKSVDANPVIADLSESVGRLWQEAGKVGLAAKDASDVPAPPAAATPMAVDALKPEGAMSKTFFGFKNLFEEANAGGALRFLVEDKSLGDSPFVCTFTETAARCRKLPSSLQSLNGLRLLATTEDGAEPLVFAGNRGSEGIHRSDSGAALDKMYAYSGHVAKDGFASVLGWEEGKKELRLVRQSQGQASQIATIKLDASISNFFYSTALLWDHLVYRGVKKNEIMMFARPLQRTGDPLGAEQEIGPLAQGGTAEGEPHVRGCMTPSTLVVKVEGRSDEYLTFLSGGKFTLPVGAPGRGGVFQCRNNEAVLTQVTREMAIQARCTAAGCNEATVKMDDIVTKDKDLAPREGYLAGADVDGKLLVLWAAGERGGLRMRLAPVEQIAKSPDVVLFDDLVQDGKPVKMSSIVEMRLFARAKFALLLLNTSAGVHALRIDPSGKTTPVPIQWSR